MCEVLQSNRAIFYATQGIFFFQNVEKVNMLDTIRMSRVQVGWIMRLLEDVHSNSWNGSRASAVPCPLVNEELSEASYVEPFDKSFYNWSVLHCW